MDKVNSASELAKQVNVLDAVMWLSSAWDVLDPETIQKCFWKCGFVAEDEQTGLESDSMSKLLFHIFVNTSDFMLSSMLSVLTAKHLRFFFNCIWQMWKEYSVLIVNVIHSMWLLDSDMLKKYFLMKRQIHFNAFYFTQLICITCTCTFISVT